MGKLKFTGELAKPIIMRSRRVTILTDTPERRAEIEKYNNEEIQRVFVESFQKMDLLFEKFEIPADIPQEGKYPILALMLARQFIPGFRIKNLSNSRGRGRAKEWDIVKYTQLLADAELLRRDKDRSDSEICRILTRSPRFVARWAKYNSRTLLNRLVEARQEKKNAMVALKNALVSTNPQNSIEVSRFFIDSFSIIGNLN